MSAPARDLARGRRSAPPRGGIGGTTPRATARRWRHVAEGHGRPGLRSWFGHAAEDTMAAFGESCLHRLIPGYPPLMLASLTIGHHFSMSDCWRLPSHSGVS
jgi:hypothetical protein